MKKNLFYLIVVLIPIVFACKNQDKFENFTIKKGVNISHWLSQSNQRGDVRLNRFTKEDVDLIASFGYDHIRLPIDEEQMWDEQGNKETEAFALLHNAIKWCMENDLRIIVDLHIIRSHHFNNELRPLWTDPSEQDKLVSMWRELSGELEGFSNGLLAYEIMNEAVADDPEEWNKLIARVISALRETEPERKIVVGSNMWQSASTFPELKIPENDPNIILSFHFYSPFAFTHHQASWTKLKDYDGPVHYPGKVVLPEDLQGFSNDVKETMMHHSSDYDKDFMIADIQKPLAYAKERNLPLYCGEFGCLPTVNQADRLQWYADFRSVLEDNGIAWANWDYKGGFGIVDKERKPYDDIITALIPIN